MTPDDWQRIKTIFDAAVELAPPERAPYLAEACNGDTKLMREVRSLLDSLASAGDFIETPADSAFHTGMSIGPYRIVQVIGEGGMGMVYQAVRVDDLYRKLVALKIVRRGLCSTVALRKFETERHILAHLDHPNIAKLLDGGATPDGQPYFVMDFIAGTPIDEHCDTERLPLRDRLKLFLTVCSAVQYAHQNFVVHRDIKPSNILVTPDGSIRLLDFGIAKLLDPEADAAALETPSVIQMMTPEYASPEQLLNEPVTTASDTWSLGVLLYVMLTGHRPFFFGSRSPQAIYEAIRDSAPRRPSSVVQCEEPGSGGRNLNLDAIARARRARTPDRLARELAGDLDNILLMALRREPERRYASVEQLAGDIERYLAGLPVTARDDTFTYRASRFVRRHKGAVATGGFAALALIAGTVATSWEAHQARIERERAERRFNDVRRVANSLLFDLNDAIRDLPGAAPARQLILTKALEFFGNLEQDAGDDRSLRRELAMAYERVGDVQNQMEETRQAVGSYRKAIAIREKLASAGVADIRREIIPNYGKLSDVLWAAGDAGASMEYSRKGLDASQALAAAPDATRQDRIRLATNYLDYGYKQAMIAGDRAHGLENCRKALGIFGELLAADPADKRLLRIESIGQDRAAEVLERDPNGQAEAVRLRREARVIRNRLN
jgi:non-specific serine/threonine protein kinase/serine/threonine-protein kinase